MPKPVYCKICDQEGHYAAFCWKREQKPAKTLKQLKNTGKHHDRWLRTRKRWLKFMPPDHAGYYYCHYCGVAMTVEEMTLDHKYTRSSHPELRYDLDNLLPCCSKDNSLRGSMSYESFCKKHYPNGTYPFIASKLKKGPKRIK